MALTLGWIIAIAVASTAASYVMTKQAMKKAKAQADAMAGVLVNKESNIEPIPVIYGERRVGGVRVFVSTKDVSGGDKNEYLYIAHVLCEGKITGISDIRLDDKPIANWSGLYTIHAFYGNDNQAYNTPDATFGTAFSGSILQEGDARWDSTHTLKGVAYLAIRLKWNKDKFQGIPDITCVVQGRALYDPRKDITSPAYDSGLGVTTHRTNNQATWQYSANSALVIRDYLTNNRFGKGLPLSAIDDSGFGVAATDCDESVTFYPNGYAGKIFDCHAVLQTDESLFDNLTKLLMGCRGFLPYSQGQYSLIIDNAKASVFTFNTDNMLSGLSIKGETKENKFNRVICKFPNSIILYEPDQATWPEAGSVEEIAFLAEDNGTLLVQEIELETVTSFYAARDLARVILKRSRNALRCSFKATSEALNLSVADVVTVNHPTPAWEGQLKLFQVESISLNYDGTVSVGLLEYDPSIYTYDLSAQEVVYPDTAFPDPFEIALPRNVTSSSSTSVAQDGTIVPSITTTWDAALDSFVSEYIVKWTAGGVTQETTVQGLSFKLDNPLYDTYVVSVASKNALGVQSAFVDGNSVSAFEDTVAPEVPTAFTVIGGFKSIKIKWTNPTAADLSHVNVKSNATATETGATLLGMVSAESFIDVNLTTSQTRHYYLQAVDFTGNASAWVYAGTATTLAGAIAPADHDIPSFYRISKASSAAPTVAEFLAEAGRAAKANDIVITTDTSVSPNLTYGWAYSGSAWVAEANFLSGNMIVSGTIAGDRINSLTTVTAGSGDNVAVLSGADDHYRMWAGKAAPATAPFSVDKEGNVILKNIYLSAGGIPLIDQDGFTPEALSQISAATNTEIDTIAKNYTTEDGSQLMTLTTTDAATEVSLKYTRDGLAAVSTVSGNQSYFEIPQSITVSVVYRKNGGAWTTLSQALTKTTSVTPAPTEYRIETILNETPTSDRWYSQTIAGTGCVNASNDIEYFLDTDLVLDANSTYDFYLTLSAVADPNGSPVTIDSDVSDTSSKTLTVTVTFGAGFYVSNGGGSQGNVVNADTLGGQLPSYYASTSYVGTAISNLVDSSPATLDTLNELAAALGDDPNFATTVSTSIGTKWTQDNTKISNWNTAYGWGNHASAGYLASSSYTASDVLTKIKTVDGSGSGLDADLLDGQHGSYYTNASNLNAGTLPDARLATATTYNLGGIKVSAVANDQNYIAFSGTTGDQDGNYNHTYIGERIYSDSEKSELVLAKYNDVEGPSGSDRIRHIANNHVFDTYTGATSAGANASLSTAVGTGTLYTRMTIRQNGDIEVGGSKFVDSSRNLTNIGTLNGGTPWHSSNDGSGSGLDADLLDGQHGSYYAPASHVHSYLPLSGGTLTGDVTFNDNVKAKFGAGGDLQIYHDGNNSYVDDTGTGALFLKTNGAGVYLYSGSEALATFNLNGAANLYYDNSLKLSTTSTGIEVTGTATMDGLVVDGDASVAGTTGVTADNGTITTGKDSTSTRSHWQMNNPNGQVARWDSNGTDLLHFITDEYKVYTAGNKAFEIDGNGDISFYEDTGTTAKLFWDASAESLGIGTTVPSNKLTINSTTGSGLKIYGADQAYARLTLDNLNGQAWDLVAGTAGASNSGFGIYDGDAGATRLQIDASGNVNIVSGNLQMGTTTVIDSSRNLTNIGTIAIGSASPQNSAKVDIYSSVTSGHFNGLQIRRPNSSGITSAMQFTLANDIMVGKIQHDYVASDHNDMSFHLRLSGGSNQEVMRFYAGPINGTRVGIGTTQPEEKLTVSGNIRASGSYLVGGTTVIDSSRNVYANYSVLGRGIRAANRGELHLNATGAGDVAEMFFGYGDGYTEGNIRWGISDRGTSDDRLIFYRGPANGGFAAVAELDASAMTLSVANGYKVNGTTVIDSSRNLTNIGSISSGDITLGGSGQTPKLRLEYVDHVYGPVWDTTIHIGRTNDLPSGSSAPTYTPAGGYGVQFQANSDGCFYGIEEYESGNYRPLINWGDDVGDTPFRIAFNNATKFQLYSDGNFTANGNVTAYSDIRLKDDIQNIENALDKVMAIRGVTYKRNDLGLDAPRQSGVIAQEVEKVLPEVVYYDKENDIKTVAYGNMAGLLIEAIKEQQSEIDELKTLVKQLLEK